MIHEVYMFDGALEVDGHQPCSTRPIFFSSSMPVRRWPAQDPAGLMGCVPSWEKWSTLPARRRRGQGHPLPTMPGILPKCQYISGARGARGWQQIVPLHLSIVLASTISPLEPLLENLTSMLPRMWHVWTRSLVACINIIVLALVMICSGDSSDRLGYPALNPDRPACCPPGQGDPHSKLIIDYWLRLRWS